MSLFNDWKFNITGAMFFLYMALFTGNFLALLLFVGWYYLALVNFEEKK